MSKPSAMYCCCHPRMRTSRALKPGSTVIDTSASTFVPPGHYSLALLDDRDLWWRSHDDGSWHKTPLGWAVRLGSESPPRQGSLLKREEEVWHLTVFRLGIGGRLYTSRLRLAGDEWERVDSAATSDLGYSAAAILGSKKFAGVRSDGIHWLRIDPAHAHALRVWDATRVALEARSPVSPCRTPRRLPLSYATAGWYACPHH